MLDNTFHIPIDSKTLVTHELIAFKGVEYPVSSIIVLMFGDSKQSYNFVPIGHIRSLMVWFTDNSRIELFSAHPILQKTKFANLAKAFQALSACTFRQRLKRYTDAWTSAGYFNYQGVRIHADGMIENIKNIKKRASLRGAITEGRVSFGASFGVSWIGYSASDPAYVAVYDTPPKGLFSKTTVVGFDCNMNRDVIMALLLGFDKSNVQQQ